LMVLGMSAGASITLSIVGGIIVGASFADAIFVKRKKETDSDLANNLIAQALDHGLRSAHRLDLLEREVAALRMEMRRI